jgi:hypothetical protein
LNIAYFVNAVPIGDGDDLGGGPNVVEKGLPLGPGEGALVRIRMQIMDDSFFKYLVFAGSCCPADYVKAVIRNR